MKRRTQQPSNPGTGQFSYSRAVNDSTITRAPGLLTNGLELDIGAATIVIREMHVEMHVLRLGSR
jgi:hypothetical protein